MSDASAPKPLLSARRLKIEHRLARGWLWRSRSALRAIDDVHFNLFPGETLAIVGASGAGKTTLAKALVGAQPISNGGVSYGGRNLARVSRQEWRLLRRDIQLLDAAAGLPRRGTPAALLRNALRAACPEVADAERRPLIEQAMRQAGLELRHGAVPVKQLRVEERQRVALACALVVRPKILIVDEPGAGLDDAGRTALLQTLADSSATQGFALLLLARRLATVSAFAQRIVVLYLGKIMEQGPASEVLGDPRHPYSRALIAELQGRAAPDAGAPAEAPGIVPSGCVYRMRCGLADAHCATDVPYQRRVGPAAFAACHYIDGAASAEVLPQMRARAAAARGLTPSAEPPASA